MLELFDTIENYINQIIVPLNWLMLVLIIGGGNIGFNLAKNIEETLDTIRVKIVEKSKDPLYIYNKSNKVYNKKA